MGVIPPRWRHQEAAFQFVRGLWRRRQNGAMLAMAMGTGKSRVAVDLALDERAEQLLILSPLRVVQVWEKQLALYAPGHFTVLALDERVDSVAKKYERAQALYKWSEARHQPVAICINYDSARVAPFSDWAARSPWDMIIADELHRSKEPRGRTSRWLAKAGLMATRRLGLTGTPMPHQPTDVWAQFRFLNPYHFDPSYGQFRSRYAKMGGYFDKEIVDWVNLDELESRFRELAFRVSEDVLDLPPVMEETRAANMGKVGARIYRDMAREMIAQIQQEIGQQQEAQVTAANPLVRLLRLAQITGGTVADDRTGEHHQIDHTKEEMLEELLSDLREPVVVFCRFKPDLEAVHRASERAGLRSLELSGEADELMEWQEDPHAAEVLAVQIQAGGVGVDLTRARVAVYYSLDFSLANYLQSRARIHRPPQSRPCVFYHLQIRHSIDEYILRAIEKRRGLIDSLLHGDDLVPLVVAEMQADMKGAPHVVAG